MATAVQLEEYATKLPQLYREILGAFPRIEPTRKAGYGLAYQSIFAYFQQMQIEGSLGDIILACEELAKNGLVEIKHRLFVHPTERGERLIAAVSGQEAQRTRIEPLPPPPL